MNMHVIAETPSPAYSQAVSATLSLEDLRRRTPAVFADSASERTTPTYRFINLCGRPHKLINVAPDEMWRAFQESHTRCARFRSAPHNTALTGYLMSDEMSAAGPPDIFLADTRMRLETIGVVPELTA